MGSVEKGIRNCWTNIISSYIIAFCLEITAEQGMSLGQECLYPSSLLQARNQEFQGVRETPLSSVTPFVFSKPTPSPYTRDLAPKCLSFERCLRLEVYTGSHHKIDQKNCIQGEE